MRPTFFLGSIFQLLGILNLICSANIYSTNYWLAVAMGATGAFGFMLGSYLVVDEFSKEEKLI